MLVTATLKNHRISAQKARLVVGTVRGLGVEDALNQLSLSNKRFAGPLAKQQVVEAVVVLRYQ